ncbi:hypothetical protein [Nocardia brasiliensis]|uniref:hypothetical protein n=1 Tax=Nocardia brasiliensis TaxID=37326 RepID=UPI0024560F5B|nr:hypothetical protein [Nocardia brasiliensis]
MKVYAAIVEHFMNKSTFQNKMIERIAELHDDPRVVEVLRDPDRGSTINLFDAGILRSSTVAALLGTLEQINGSPLPIEKYGMEAFFTLDSMYQAIILHQPLPTSTSIKATTSSNCNKKALQQSSNERQ